MYTTSACGSRPCSCAALRPTLFTISVTRWGRSSRNTPTVSTSSCGSRFTMLFASSGVTMRGLPGANTKPSASAPSATARRASSSFVMPQILTNMVLLRAGGSPYFPIGTSPTPAKGGHSRRSSVDQTTVEVIVVGREVEQAVAAVVEQDHPLLPALLGRQRLVDDGPDRVPGLRGR